MFSQYQRANLEDKLLESVGLYQLFLNNNEELPIKCLKLEVLFVKFVRNFQN